MKIIKNLLCISTLLFSVSAFADAFNVDIGSEYDATNSVVFEPKIAAAFGENKTNALAFEIGIGAKTMRTNVTYGFKTYNNHMWKVTGDVLHQNREFDYGGGFGKHDEEVNQYSVGSAYRYNLGGSFFKGLELSSYFSYAPSVKSNFKPEPVIYLPVGEGVYDAITFHGRLAGSKLNHHEVSLEVSPFQDGLLSVGADYEKLSFDNRWFSIKDSTNVGGHLKFSQVLLPWLKANYHYRFLQAQQSYGGSVSALIPSPKNVQFELIANISHENNTGIAQEYTRGGLTLRSELWVDKHTTSYKGSYTKKSLRAWVSEPVVRIRDVMVVPETSYSKGQVNTWFNPPTNEFLRNLSSLDHYITYDDVNWERGMIGDFNIQKSTFYKAEYYAISGHVIAYYNDDGNPGEVQHNHIVMFFYEGNRAVNHTLENWKPSKEGTVFTCIAKDATACKFEVKL